MQAITTTYHGPTNARGSRIVAKSSSGISVSLGYNDALNSDGNHRAAAAALCVKLDWMGTLYGGDTRDGMVWVFQNPDCYIVMAPSPALA